MNKEPIFENVVKWHARLHDSDMRGSKAMLRRCKTVSEIYLNPLYVKLIQDLSGYPKETLAVVAGVLANVKPAIDLQNTQSFPSLAEQMAKIRDGRVIISPIRFRQLLACKNSDKLLRLLIRIVSQVDYFDTIDFAEKIYYWNLKSKKIWAFNYYSHVPNENNPKGE